MQKKEEEEESVANKSTTIFLPFFFVPWNVKSWLQTSSRKRKREKNNEMKKKNRFDSRKFLANQSHDTRSRTQNPRARNIKKHFEETKAQRGKEEGEVGWKIETIATRGYEEQSGIPSNSSGKSVTRYGWIAPLVRRGRNAAEFVIFPFKADRKNSRPSGRSGARRAEESAFYRGPWKFARKSIGPSVENVC